MFNENSKGALWYYNVSFGNTTNGLRDTNSLAATPNEECRFWNNVLYDNGEETIWAQGLWLYVAADTIKNQHYKNNIAIPNAGQYALWAVSGGENATTDYGRGSGNVYEYNCFGVERTGFIGWGYAWDVGDDFDTYDAWETAYGGSTHSVEADPLMVDPANNDFTLQDGSPCIKTGINVNLPFDYAGRAVGDPPCIGAYEYVAGLVASLATRVGLLTHTLGYEANDESNQLVQAKVAATRCLGQIYVVSLEASRNSSFYQKPA
jgi:hypothetical protein